MNNHPYLTSPIRLGRTTFRNRMFAAPMGGTDITADCAPGFRTPYFYELRAKGGAAAVTASELVVHPETDRSHMFHLDLSTPGTLPGFTFIADSISRHGAIASVELSHSGQYAGTYMADKKAKSEIVQFGPSDGVRPDGLPVRALTTAQIDSIIEAYGNTAALAKRAGFGMIMVHGGHGWLINQFLSPYFNHRTDEYGGSLENRTRFAREVLECVRKAVGPGFPIEFRMSGSELFDGGYDVDEGARIAMAVEEWADLIHVSAGSYQFGFFNTHPSMFSEHGCNVHLAEEIKKHVSKPVATIGALNDPDQMEEIIATGKADVVEMARALLADPELPNKVMAGKDDEIVSCLRCFTCMAERVSTGTRRCAVNPLIGREHEAIIPTPAVKKKKVLVAGGGIAGLEAALEAARKGHSVTLCEKTNKCGGILIGEQAIPFKKEMYELGNTMTRLCEREGVDIRYNTSVDAAFVKDFAPDALIVALGSRPIIPPLPGIGESNVIAVTDYHKRKADVTDEVVILGGGLAGCELAVWLGQSGKKVRLVEMRDSLAPDANVRNRPILMKMVDKYVETVHLGTRGLSIGKEGLLASKDGKEFVIPGSTIILAVGQRSNSEAVDELRLAAPFVRIIGDAVRPSNITNAMYEGYHAACDI